MPARPRLAPAALLALALFLAAPLATAQGVEPTWEVTLEGGLPVEVTPDSVVDAEFALRVTGSGFGCLQAQTLEVALAASGGIPGVVLEVPATVTFQVPQGAYLFSDFTANETVDARILVSRFAEQGAAVAFTLTAQVDVEALSCIPAAAGPAGADLALVTRVAEVQLQEFEHPSHETHGGFDVYLLPGEAFTWTFDEPGIYTYHDHLEWSRTGAVHVVEDEAAAASATVRITAVGYEPEEVTIRVGGSVTWVNEHDQTRTVSQDELHGGHELEHGNDHDHGHDHDEGRRLVAAPLVMALLALAGLALLARRRA